jgi:hypothetical protein
MRTFTIVLAAALTGLPLAASAAEVPLPTVHKTRTVHHVHVRHVPRVHYGYYWYRWGWREGGTARSWYGSVFTFERPWW